jgi:hypothetical protein
MTTLKSADTASNGGTSSHATSSQPNCPKMKVACPTMPKGASFRKPKAASKAEQAKKCPLPDEGEYEDVRFGSLVLRYYKEDRK